MDKLTTIKVILHSIALFIVMLIGDFVTSILWDILFIFIKLPYEWMYGLFRIPTCIVMTLILFYLYSTRVLKTNLSFFRISAKMPKSFDIFLALLLPAIVIAFYIFYGKVTISDNLSNIVIISIIIESLLRALKAGILEEILFRGFIMKLVELRWNKYIAIIVPSLIFSISHIFSMESFSIIGLFILLCGGTLAGIMFSLFAYRGNSIYSSIPAHIIWNFSIIGILHFGNEASNDAILSIIIPTKNPLLTGGDFGIEASIIACVAYLIISSIILISLKRDNQSLSINNR